MRKKARVELVRGDCRKRLAEMRAESVDACVCDPPYELGFMGKGWDGSGVAFDPATWREVLRVLKPGAHLLAFGGTRTYHRMACAIEDAGFEIRDCIMWVYGNGFPKSLDVSKALDKRAGTKRKRGRKKLYADGTAAHVCRPSEGHFTRPFQDDPAWQGQFESEPATDAARQWRGWGTALKPAYEPILLARKPLAGTVADNVLPHGTGAINIDGCRVFYGRDESASDLRRVDSPHSKPRTRMAYAQDEYTKTRFKRRCPQGHLLGRWPANLIHDGSEEVVATFDIAGNDKGGGYPTVRHGPKTVRVYGKGWHGDLPTGPTDMGKGSAARFFYCAKASRKERGEGNVHPTVKPQALMRYLVRLVTPPRGLILDPFLGSGSTALAALAEDFRILGIEQDAGYLRIARRRLARAETRNREQEKRR